MKMPPLAIDFHSSRVQLEQWLTDRRSILRRVRRTGRVFSGYKYGGFAGIIQQAITEVWLNRDKDWTDIPALQPRIDEWQARLDHQIHTELDREAAINRQQIRFWKERYDNALLQLKTARKEYLSTVKLASAEDGSADFSSHLAVMRDYYHFHRLWREVEFARFSHQYHRSLERLAIDLLENPLKPQALVD